MYWSRCVRWNFDPEETCSSNVSKLKIYFGTSKSEDMQEEAQQAKPLLNLLL